MSRIEEAIKLLKQFYCCTRDFTLVNKAIELLESAQAEKPEPTEFTKTIRNKISEFNRTHELYKWGLREKETLEACEIIDRLTAENKDKDKLLKEALPIIYNTYQSDDIGPKSLPSRIEQVLKGESNEQTD